MRNQNYHKAKTILQKYLEGKCTKEEKDWIEKWYLSIGQEETDLSPEQLKEDLRELKDRNPWRHFYRVKWYRVAAVILAVLVSAIWWQRNSIEKEKLAIVEVKADFEPGSNKAILKIEGRAEIELQETEESIVSGNSSFHYENGTFIESIEKVQNVSVITPVGGQYKVVLPDGTQAWLNAVSSLSFPSAFDKYERRIKVTGEVYLDVIKNPEAPFIVETSRQHIKVLGTSFNIHEYEDENESQTTLTEGSLLIKNTHSQETVRIKPGQQAKIKDDKTIKVDKVNAEEISSWKEGLSVVNDETLNQYAKKIERWYGVEVDMGSHGSKRFSTIIPRDAKLLTVLGAIELKSGVQFQIEGRRIKAME